MQGINYVFRKTYSRLSHKEKGSRLLTLLHNGDLCGNQGIDACKDYVQCIGRKQFCAWRLCKTCDTASVGSLNGRGIESLRNCENLSKWQRGMIAS